MTHPETRAGSMNRSGSGAVEAVGKDRLGRREPANWPPDRRGSAPTPPDISAGGELIVKTVAIAMPPIAGRRAPSRYETRRISAETAVAVPDRDGPQGFLTNTPGALSTYWPDGVLAISFSAASFSTAFSDAPDVRAAIS